VIEQVIELDCKCLRDNIRTAIKINRILNTTPNKVTSANSNQREKFRTKLNNISEKTNFIESA